MHSKDNDTLGSPCTLGQRDTQQLYSTSRQIILHPYRTMRGLRENSPAGLTARNELALAIAHLAVTSACSFIIMIGGDHLPILLPVMGFLLYWLISVHWFRISIQRNGAPHA